MANPLVSGYPIDHDQGGLPVSDQNDDIKTAASDLTHSVSGLVRALDARGDDGAAAADIPDGLVEELERLVARLNAASGFEG